MDGNPEITPMFRQYAEHKKQHKDAVLFFRMGDFYEMFRTDAVEVSRLLNLTLTQRQGVPMCGIPYHAAGNYISRLLKLGKKIAICEQIQLPEDGKGLATREVIEVVTPGTVVDDLYLDSSANNYLAAIAGRDESPAFAYIDLSTGEFRVTLPGKDRAWDALRRELARTAPRELIVQESLLEKNEYSFLNELDLLLDRMPDWSFDHEASFDRLIRQFGTVNLRAFGLDDDDPRIPAAGCLIEYLQEKHRRLLPHIRSIRIYGESDAVGLDESTIRNLELVRNLRDGSRMYTLLDVLDHTKTAPGARLLRRRILQPWPDPVRIGDQHEMVERLYRDQRNLSAIRGILSSVLDLERLAARTAMDRAHAKDLLAVRDSLLHAMEIRRHLQGSASDVLVEGLDPIAPILTRLIGMLSDAILDDPSVLMNEGRLIRDGWDTEIDRLRGIRSQGTGLLETYVEEERAATGINGLKLKYNRILGYFLEVGKGSLQKVPDRYRRRQTLTQSERFSTDRLDELQSEITSVSGDLVEREREVFLDVRGEVKACVPELLTTAAILADLDVTQSAAHAATEYGYIRPRMTGEPETDIRGGRHPVVEHHLPSGSFVPNDIVLSGEGVSFMMVTGPNMAGKSTVLRQAALITLMAQAGSFIPADSAVIGVADRIFCRVGASDNLARGESTFLVEMIETANILRNATDRSLVIMDEVGRGTGTEDGLAIARAVCEYLLNHQTPRTLFATHFRELTRIGHPRMRNMSMSVREDGGRVVFPKKLIEGPAEASYGIHVGAIAGLPEEVLSRARLLLHESNRSLVVPADEPGREYPEDFLKKGTGIDRNGTFLLFDPEELILDRIRDLDTDELTPLEALNLLSLWKKELDSGSR